MLERAARLKGRSPYLLEGVVLVAPAKPRQIEQHTGLFDFLRPIVPAQSPERICAVEDETIDPLRMPRGVADRDWSAPARRQKVEAAERGGVDDRFEIAYPIVERKSVGIAVGQAAAAGIVAQQLAAAAEGIEPRPPRQAAPLMLKMSEPRRRHDQRRSIAAQCVGELDAVAGRAKADVLVRSGQGLSQCWVQCDTVPQFLFAHVRSGSFWVFVTIIVTLSCSSGGSNSG